MDLRALECMLKVCKSTHDPIRELSTLKSIRPLLLANAGSEKYQYSLEGVDKEIAEVERRLEEKFSN